MFLRWKTLEITAFLWKTPAAALRGRRSRVCAAVEGYPKAERPARANLVANTPGWLAYSLMSRSGAGGMRGGEGERTSTLVTV